MAFNKTRCCRVQNIRKRTSIHERITEISRYQNLIDETIISLHRGKWRKLSTNCVTLIRTLRFAQDLLLICFDQSCKLYRSLTAKYQGIEWYDYLLYILMIFFWKLGALRSVLWFVFFCKRAQICRSFGNISIIACPFIEKISSLGK